GRQQRTPRVARGRLPGPARGAAGRMAGGRSLCRLRRPGAGSRPRRRRGPRAGARAHRGPAHRTGRHRVGAAVLLRLRRHRPGHGVRRAGQRAGPADRCAARPAPGGAVGQPGHGGRHGSGPGLRRLLARPGAVRLRGRPSRPGGRRRAAARRPAAV
ncbi:MAG: hypothetical protein AVDCRST_MAG07-1552, partial [uncultured Frankineae bacterium]